MNNTAWRVLTVVLSLPALFIVVFFCDNIEDSRYVVRVAPVLNPPELFLLTATAEAVIDECS